MNKIMKSMFVFLAMMLFSSSASAQDFTPYVGGGLGGYVISNGSGAKWVFGGYGSVGVDINDYIAVEFRGGKTAEATNKSGNFGTDWIFSYLAKPQIKLEDYKINFYALLGASTIKSWSNSHGAHKTKTSFSFGGGIEVYATENIILGAEGMVLDFQKKDGPSLPYNGNNVGSAVATARILF